MNKRFAAYRRHAERRDYSSAIDLGDRGSRQNTAKFTAERFAF
jgi:hypothetical protein